MEYALMQQPSHMELWSVVGRKVKGILRRKNINEQSSFCPISTSVFAGLSPALGPGGRHQLQLLTATFLTTTHALMSTTLWLQTQFNRCGIFNKNRCCCGVDVCWWYDEDYWRLELRALFSFFLGHLVDFETLFILFPVCENSTCNNLFIYFTIKAKP